MALDRAGVSRRSVLCSAAAAALCAGPALASAGGQATLEAFLRARFAPGDLAAIPELSSPAALAAAEALLDGVAETDPAEIARVLARRIEADFARGDISLLRGWIFAKTEVACLACVLRAERGLA